ncbi:MAG TPA: alpha/beta hydrolase, partial [Streptomyces sp.]|nr:alpha/beta hydrolase [Streptomyces sp.]
MTYEIDPEFLPWLDMTPPSALTDLASLLAARTLQEQLIDVVPGYEPVNPIDVRDTAVPGPADAPDVPVRVYSPRGAADALPGLLYLHGGGFVAGSTRVYHRHALRLADKLGVVIVSVDYRLAPENPVPAPVEDCYAAL